MECFLQELIDTLWNVNSEVMSIKDEYTAELIDTLWNVNSFTTINKKDADFELIDTLWNVNNKDVGEMTKEQMN